MAGQKGFRSGFVTLIGRPNVGKSTLMNHLIGQKIAITSNKPQTTRNRIKTVYTDERGQIVFLDTPGIHKAQHELGNVMNKFAIGSLDAIDLVLFVVDASSKKGAGDDYILEELKKRLKEKIMRQLLNINANWSFLKDTKEIIEEILELTKRPVDIIEWRVDAFLECLNFNEVRDILQTVAPHLSEKIFLTPVCASSKFPLIAHTSTLLPS